MHKIFEKIPLASVDYVKSLIYSENVVIKLKKTRKTKHGDFSVNKNGLRLITINESLNKYRFLITLIHEISHYFTFKNYGIYIKPHGVEWKNTFRSLLLPVINSDVFPTCPSVRLFLSFLVSSALLGSIFRLSFDLFPLAKLACYVFMVT